MGKMRESASGGQSARGARGLISDSSERGPAPAAPLARIAAVGAASAGSALGRWCHVVRLNGRRTWGRLKLHSAGVRVRHMLLEAGDERRGDRPKGGGTKETGVLTRALAGNHPWPSAPAPSRGSR
ncbi:hypothetical protein KM043_000274 [Ampulex compressa]|nr:hypothetical protein KM043_000274 [Ampulex compressa]